MNYIKHFFFVAIALLLVTKVLASICDENGNIRVAQGTGVEIGYAPCVDLFDELPSCTGGRLTQGTSECNYDAVEVPAQDPFCLSTNVQGQCPGTLNVPSQYETIIDALAHAVDGDTILIAQGTYTITETIIVDKNNITIASEFLNSEDESDIDNTILIGDPEKHLIDGKLNIVDGQFVGGDSANLKIIGLTIKDARKGVTFTDDYGEVHHCKFYDIWADAISFDLNAGGTVTHCYIKDSGDDAIDIDTVHDGSFEIAYNEIISPNDDGIEVHNYEHYGTNMHYNIHDNLFSGVRWFDGIQIIDFDTDTARTYDIYRNIFENNYGAGIGTMFEETEENFKGSAMTERVRIYNNYFYNNKYHITGGDNMIILNNIFEKSEVAINRVKTDSIVDYNLFFDNAIDVNDTVTGDHNLTTDPKSNSDYTLRSDSPAIDAGTAEYIHNSETVLTIPANEYNGAAPDMGRYEH